MKVIPIIPVKAGRITNLYYDDGLKSGREFHDFHKVMDYLSQIYETHLFMDMDAIYTGTQQIELLKELCEMNQVWVEPGISRYEDIIDPLVAGGDCICVSTATLHSLDVLGEIVDLSDRVIPMIQWANGEIVHNYHSKKTGIEDLQFHLDTFMDLDLETVTFLDVGRINLREGMDEEILRPLTSTGLDIYIGGGLREEDVIHYSGLGVKGILLYINDLLEHVKMMRPKDAAVAPREMIEVEPSIQLNPLGFPEYS